MIDPELAARLDAIDAKLDAAFQAADKTRKYLLWTGIASIAFIVLPAIALVFVVPSFLSSYTSELNGGTNGVDINSLLGN